MSSIIDVSSNEDILSSDSEQMPKHYILGDKRNAEGEIIKIETNEQKKEKHLQRMRDFHRILGKYHVCILPNLNQSFEDHMPIFNIFTADYSKTNHRSKKALFSKE